MKVDFERLHWENYPSTDTPLNADNLNRLEEGVAGLYSDVAEIEEELGDGVGEYVTEWLDEHVTPGGSTIVVDDTLSVTGAAADAKKTGDEISDLDDRVATLEEGGSESGLTDDIKQALLQIAEKVAYIDEHGQAYYDDLYNALYEEYTVTNNLDAVTNSNPATTATGGSSYAATLSADSGYITTLSITMGGRDITESVWTPAT